MTKPRRLLSYADSVETKVQHTKPCSDCIWTRASLPGWLGNMSAEEWLAAAHGEGKADCHVFRPHQCAGMAVYRANVAKSPRDPSTMRLPADRVNVFATPQEFLQHHEKPLCRSTSTTSPTTQAAPQRKATTKAKPTRSRVGTSRE